MLFLNSDPCFTPIYGLYIGGVLWKFKESYDCNSQVSQEKNKSSLWAHGWGGKEGRPACKPILSVYRKAET